MAPTTRSAAGGPVAGSRPDEHSIAPWIITRDTAALLHFLGAAFGAEERGRVPNPDGTIGHAEVRIGDSTILAFDAQHDWPPTPAFVRLFVEDADATVRRAVAAGATVVTEVEDTFFGDRGGRLRDPFGNVWWIQSHVEDVDQATILERLATWRQAAVDPGRHAERTLDHELRGRIDRSVPRVAPSRPGVPEMRLELVPVPVTDVDRARDFYVGRVGFHLDVDSTVSPELRFVQLTPPGSACSIVIGTGITPTAPGSQQGLQMVVEDAETARRHLLDRGVAASEVDVQPWGSFVRFSDPDGNSWSLQELPPRP